MKRNKDESFEDYKIRRTVQKEFIKRHLKGRVIWNPKEILVDQYDNKSFRGQYRNPERQPICCLR